MMDIEHNVLELRITPDTQLVDNALYKDSGTQCNNKSDSKTSKDKQK